MALPNKVVEQLGRAPVRTPGWSGRVLMFSGTFLIISVTTFLGIRFGLQPYTTSQVKNLDTRVAEFARQVPVEQQLEIAALYSQVVNLRNLLDKQTSQVEFLRWVERNTNTSVQITELSLENKGKGNGSRSLTIAGKARALDNLAEQLNLFRSKSGLIDKVELSSVQPPEAGSGPWVFRIGLALNKNFYPKISVPEIVIEPVVVDEEEVIDQIGEQLIKEENQQN